MARGRTDLARAHRAQAIAIALTFGGLGVGAYGWANDFVSPDFAEVVGRSDSAEALGDDLFVIAGSQPRREALSTAFVYDARNGRAVSAGPLLPFFSTGSRFVASGGRALFWPEQSRSTFRLARAERSPIGLAISEASIDLDPRTSPWAVSLDGERLATVAPTGNEGSFLLGVHEIGTGRLLSSTRVALSVSWQCRLAGEGDGFRLVGVDSGSNLESWRVERNGTARRTAHVPGAEIDFGWFLDAEGGRIFVKRAQPSEGWALLDSTSLEPIALLRPPILDQPGATLSFLVALFPDGSIGTAARTGARRELALFSASGELISSSTWPATGTTRFVGSGAQRTLLLATRTGGKSEASATGWTVERFDLDSGARRVVARDLLPMSTRPMTRPGQVLLRDENGRLFALEPDSGELRELPKTW